MKETVSANIGSQSFTLDTDAYGTLKSYLDDVRSRLPEDDTETMGDIEARLAEIFREKTGGGAENRISSAMLIVQSYGTSMLDVIQLNEEVKQAMEGAEELAEIVRCSLNSDYNFPATNIKRRRYQAVFDIVHY